MSTAPRNFKFVTITGDDWRRSLRAARARVNTVLVAIKLKGKKL